ncbi:MAG TPA: class A beta-lactamase-related serine hydrolase [Planctomycetes bacterium]|nr:class A beta-lactamase-related serine hydrolase [Fuerstiella sp.]HIK93968.1 class A beta-lactamase-related serine hydrolase [Planctomycetota bacterium]
MQSLHTLKICAATSVIAFGFVNSGLAGSGSAASLESIRQKHKLPALAVAVIVDGKLIVFDAVGERKLGSKVAVTRDDKFHMGSCTKAMTATLIGILVDQGKLSWDLKIVDVLPDLAKKSDPGYRDVTIDQLLMHRAGLPGESYKGVDPGAFPKAPREQRMEYIRQLMKTPPQFRPGSRFQYSNAGYSVAGVMAEMVMDRPWEELMSEFIFQPLKMTSAGFGAMGSAQKMDQPWQHRLQAGKPIAVRPSPRADNLDAIGPAGKVHCSMADWAKFVGVHLGASTNRKPLLAPATLKHLHEAGFNGNYAGGWTIAQRSWAGGAALSHSGSNTMNFCTAWLAPKKRFAVLSATNCAGDAARQACDDVASTMIQKYLSDTSDPIAKSNAQEDKSVTVKAKTWFRQVQEQRIRSSQLNPGLRTFFASSKGKDFCITLNKLGDSKSFDFQSSRKLGDGRIYVYELSFDSGNWRWEIGFGKNDTVNWILAKSQL